MDRVDNFAWVHLLECPLDACTDVIKKTLYKGMFSFLWDNIGNAAFTVAQAEEIRKNILLSKLKNNSFDTDISSMISKMQLLSEINKIDAIASQLEEEHERWNILIKEKLMQLRKIKSTRLSLKTRKDILRLKRDQTSTQLSDCKDMKLVCQHLMPGTGKNLNEEVVAECFRTVATMWSGADKNQVWQVISNKLGPIETTVLWEKLQQNFSQDLNRLIDLGKTLDLAPKENFNTISENIDVGIGTACAEHVEAVIKRVACKAKVSKAEAHLLQFIQQIEVTSTSHDNLSEWVALALEGRKLEVERACLQNEIDRIKKSMDDNVAVSSNLAQMVSDIETIDLEMEKYVQDVRQSLVLLKSAGLHLNRIREKMRYKLQRIAAMHAENHDYKWLNNKLNTELNVFYNNLDLSALRKIMLKGCIGEYRHTKFCISEAPVTISALRYPDIAPHFSAIHTPVSLLINCYKHLATNFLYKNIESRAAADDHRPVDSLDWNIPEQRTNFNTIELYEMSKQACERARDEIDQFHSILNAWCTQSIQDISVLREMSVDGMSFSDWLQQYSVLLYMIQSRI